jgi:hypothetical protein
VRLFRGRDPKPQLHVGDPRFDDWEVVAGLRELGLAAEMTTDHPLDEFKRGDIALRVPGDQYGDATVALDGLEP